VKTSRLFIAFGFSGKNALIQNLLQLLK